MIKPGETPCLSVEIESELDNVDKIMFTLASGDNLITKTYPDEVEFRDGKYLIGYTQEETMGFNVGLAKLEAQICFKNNSVRKSIIIPVEIGSTLYTGMVSGTPDLNADGNTIKISVSDVAYGYDGATFTPVPSTPRADTLRLEWTNDKGKENPEAAEIVAPTGPQGEQGLKGERGEKGEKGDKGDTPQKGVDYFTDEDVKSLNIPSVDQTYSPNSENAQSGKAVAEAVAPKADKTYVDDIVNELNNRFPSIKTVMDEVAVASAQYYLGEVTELNITLPEDAEIGQEITASWYNGETASTLAIDGNMLDFDYTPEANTRSEINALWDGTYWSVIGMSQEVPV